MIKDAELSVDDAFYALLDPSNRKLGFNVLTNINSQDENGLTVLHHAIIKLNSSPEDKIAINIKDVIEFLLQDPNLKPNIQDRHGMTALHYAVMNQDFETIKLLIEKKADTNISDIHGNIPLHYAAQKNLEDVISYRFKKLEHPEMISIVDYLILSGSDLNVRNDNGQSPYDIARENGNPKATMALFLCSPPLTSRKFIHDYFTNFYKNKNLRTGAIELSSAPTADPMPSLHNQYLDLFQTFRQENKPLFVSKASGQKLPPIIEDKMKLKEDRGSKSMETRREMLNKRMPNKLQPPRLDPNLTEVRADLTLRTKEIPLSRRNILRGEHGVSEEEGPGALIVPEPDPIKRTIPRGVIEAGPKPKPMIEESQKNNKSCSIS